MKNDPLYPTPGRPTKLLVKKVGTRKFLRATGQWSREVEMAFSFPNLLNAIHLCFAKDLPQVDLVIRWEGECEERCYRLDLTQPHWLSLAELARITPSPTASEAANARA